MPREQNPFEDLVELTMRTAPCQRTPNGSRINADLRVGKAEIDVVEDVYFSVQTKRLVLDLDLSGYDVVPGLRLGDPRPNANPAPGSFFSSGGGGISKSAPPPDERTVEGDGFAKHEAIKPRGGLKWEICHADPKQVLDDAYLVDASLCSVTAQRGANAQSIKLEVKCRQRDLDLKVIKKNVSLISKSANHEAMLKIILARALDYSGSKYTGTVTLSRVEIGSED